MAMNTRQLAQGLLPTLEYERSHTYKSFRQFPELRQSVPAVESIPFSSSKPENQNKKARSVHRTVLFKSTHLLENLCESSYNEASQPMQNFRQILLNSRRSKVLSSESSERNLESEYEHTSSSVNKTPLERANEKLTKISLSFDALSYNSHLAGFSGTNLSKNEFRTQLRRCLNINLKSEELDALFENMDEDGSTLIDGVEFIRYFLKLGADARFQIQLDKNERLRRREEISKRKLVERVKKMKEWQAKQTSTPFDAGDFSSAIEKLTEIALRWDPTDELASIVIKQFQAYFSPFDFKMQILKTLVSANFSAREIAALTAEYSVREGDCCVDGYLFVTKIISLQREGQVQNQQRLAALRDCKNKILRMGQSTDIMPKALGR